MSFGRPIAPTVFLFAIVAGCASLYFYRLDFAPPNIEIDEAIIAINAHSIATTAGAICAASYCRSTRRPPIIRGTSRW